MKKMMKLLALALAIVTMMSSAMVAFAEEEPASAEPAQKVEQKAEEPKAEEPKAEAPKAEAPKAEAPKAEEPKAEEPKAEEPEAEESEAEELEDESETVVMEDEAVPMSSGKELELTVSIKASNQNAKVGDTVTLTAVVTADQSLEGREITYQWLVDKADGKGFRKVGKKGNKQEYTVKLTEKKAEYTWRVKVHVD